MKITKQQILSGDNKALQLLLGTFYLSAETILEGELGIIDEAQCLAVAKAIENNEITVHWQEKSLELLVLEIQQKFPTLPPLSLAYIRFCYDILTPYLRMVQLDKALLKEQDVLRQKLFLQSLVDGQFWLEHHPLKNIVDYLYLALLGWQSDFGQHSDNLLAIYQETIAQLSTIPLDKKANFMQLEKQLRQKIADLQGFLDKFTQRIKDTEVGKIKNRSSQLTAIQFLNQLLDNASAPHNLLQFLQQDLLPEIHVFLVNHGLEHAVWQELQQLLTELVAIYKPHNNLTDKQKQLPAALQAIFEKNLTLSDKANDFINNIAFDISQISAGISINDCVTIKKITMPEHLENIETHVTQPLVDNGRQYKEGQWFLLRQTDNSWERCKLLLKLDDYNQLLFCNFVGQRSLVASYEDFAYLLSAKHIQTLAMYGALTRCVHGRLDQLTEKFEVSFQEQQQTVQRIKTERIQAEKELARQKAAEKARAEAQAIAKRRAEIAAQEQAAKKAEEQRLAAIKQQEQQAQLEADLRRQTRLSLDALILGAWIEYKDNNGHYQRIKLAVKFAATGRFIFVDDNGLTVIEAQRDELVEMMLDGRIKHLDSDKKFAERLAKIVTDIRESK